jgi:hypothetical protein
VTGAAALTINNSKIVNCKTDGDGGGMSTRGQTVVTLVGNVVISDCESKVMGGGVLVEIGKSRCPSICSVYSHYVLTFDNAHRSLVHLSLWHPTSAHHWS